MTLRRFTALLLALALAATACGGGSTATADRVSGSETESTESDGGDASDSDSSDSADTGGSAVEDGATSMAASSPIGAFFAEDGGFEAAMAEFTVQVEEEIVRCMAAEGFEFARTEQNFNQIQELQSDLTAREWTSQFGYGISTSFDSLAQNQASDPNGEIIFGLSAAERELWIATLTGGGFGEDPTDFEATPLEEQGCIGQALIETGGQEAIEGMESFGMAYEEGQEALFDRREMVEVVDAWSRCLSEAGFPGYADNEAPEEDITERFEAVIAPVSAAIDGLSDEEGQALFSGESFDLADLPDLDLTALRDLQAQEIDLALADLDCYEAEVQSTFEPLRDALENGLLDEFSAEFEELLSLGS